MNLPEDFPHEPPKNYTYDVVPFKRDVLGIWCCNHSKFNYNGGIAAKTIWGFYNTKKRQYHAPINSKKIGAVVDISSTRPYTAMTINLSPLERAFYD